MMVRAGWLGWVVILGGLTACHAVPPIPPYVSVRNHGWVPDPVLHSTVLVVPFDVSAAPSIDAELARSALLMALRELHQVEVVALSPATSLRSRIPTKVERSEAMIDALIQWRQEYGVSSVLFGSVTFHRPYGEPALGYRLTLVDARNGEILWGADDVLDAEEPLVRAALASFQSQMHSSSFATAPDHLPLEVFARFVASSFALSWRPLSPDSAETPTEIASVN